MIVIDASAAIDLVAKRPNYETIAGDLVREGPTAVPAHFEADAYAGLRHMVTRRDLDRDLIPAALDRIAEMPRQRAALAPLLPAAYGLFDRIGAHDSFYVALALATGARLVTSDGRQARAARQLGVDVLLRTEVDGSGQS